MTLFSEFPHDILSNQSVVDQPGVEPSNGLVESLLLSVPLDLLTGVAADGESVLDTTVQVDLVRVAALQEDLLGLVALLGGEDLVRLSGGDGQRSLEARELLFVDERRVGEKAYGDGGVVAGDVLHHYGQYHRS